MKRESPRPQPRQPGPTEGLAENTRAALLGAQDRERDRQVAEEPAAEGPHLL